MSVFPAMGAVPRGGGFRMEDSWAWCSCAVEEPGKGFHLYASRWRKDYPMFEGYIFFSEIVRAFSENPEGPYRCMENWICAIPLVRQG